MKKTFILLILFSIIFTSKSLGFAMEFVASSEDITKIYHAHPTLSEAVKETALSVDKRAIHS